MGLTPIDNTTRELVAGLGPGGLAVQPRDLNLTLPVDRKIATGDGAATGQQSRPDR